MRILTNVADSLSIRQLVVAAADSAQTMSGYFYAYTEMCNIASHCITDRHHSVSLVEGFISLWLCTHPLVSLGP